VHARVSSCQLRYVAPTAELCATAAVAPLAAAASSFGWPSLELPTPTSWTVPAVPETLGDVITPEQYLATRTLFAQCEGTGAALRVFRQLVCRGVPAFCVMLFVYEAMGVSAAHTLASVAASLLLPGFLPVSVTEHAPRFVEVVLELCVRACACVRVCVRACVWVRARWCVRVVVVIVMCTIESRGLSTLAPSQHAVTGRRSCAV
jgi:hypothetical protein